ncbi:unnamed protein product [Mycena citricolor]|uniref:Glycosyl hydrolase family 13 catalytic domain-containing protein n=1 Tax=Mycena citricolor TaxID=2018698 RepID=A0AAD2H5P0_9AGAR|nr:unnamed protein product [Mycena citricolor]
MSFNFRGWFSGLFSAPPALSRMRLGPEESTDNALMLQFFTWDALQSDMSWWAHVEREVPGLSEMGFTQFWLPPPNKGAEPLGRGYDAYDLWDLGTVPTRWGTREEFLRACDGAKKHGVDILIDAVLNVRLRCLAIPSLNLPTQHKLGADRFESFPAVQVNPDNRMQDMGPAREIDGWTAFDFEGRGTRCDTRARCANVCLSCDSTAASDGTRSISPDSTGIIRHRPRLSFGFQAKDGRDGHNMCIQLVSTELGNYDYLLGIDIDHRHPDVQKDLLDWGLWITETTGASGFRLDAIKHMDRRFLYTFLNHVRNAHPQMFAVCKSRVLVLRSSIKDVAGYIKAFKGQVWDSFSLVQRSYIHIETAFFDVPLHHNFHLASKQGSRYDLRKILDNTIVKWKPGDAVTFVDNHDTVIGQSLESWVGDDFKLQAYALILLRGHGHPCVFYGDLYPNKECFNPRIAQALRLLIEARKRFAYGACVDYRTDKNCIGFVRHGDSTRPGCVVVLSNRDPVAGAAHDQIRMSVGRTLAGQTFVSFLTPQDSGVQVESDGSAVFSCPPNQVQIWTQA